MRKYSPVDISWADGVFVGLLSPEEIEEFDRLVKMGWAYHSYEGGGGFMGLAKVRFR
jgi:hypothetical protein